MIKKTVITSIVVLLIGIWIQKGNVELLDETKQEGLESAEYWIRIENLLNKYFDYPSTENALELFNALPKNIITVKERIKAHFHKSFELAYKNIFVLQRQAWTGDRNAVRLVYRLFNISDAAFTEELDSTIANLIRINPRLYLEELKYNRNNDYIKFHGPPLFTGDLDLRGNEKASRLMDELTIKALETINDKSLITIRNECIGIIKKCIS